MALCKTCAGLKVSEMRGKRTYIHDDLRSLRDSAAAGCSACQLFWTSIPGKPFIRDGPDGEAPTSNHVQVVHDDRVWLELPVRKNYEVLVKCKPREMIIYKQKTLIGRLNVFADPRTPAAFLCDGRFFTADRDTDGHITFALKQLADCQERHPKCRIDTPPEMPTRVLDVGSSPSSTKLVEAFAHNLREPYLALSYCWGRSMRHAMKLDSSNYPSCLESIDEEALTVAHRECIAIARQLGIRYVWIDALCIIQGSSDDWDYESTRMAQTYGNAILTIIAGRSSDADASFVVSRPKQKFPPCAVSFAQGEGDVFLSLPRARTEGPISMRAWCFQEKVLSRRTLLYAEEQVCFSCQRFETWEDGSKNMLGFSKLRVKSFPSPPEDIGRAEQDRLRAQMLTLWYEEILPDYTIRDLTYPTDVFAAIGSIAQLAQNSIRSRYLAGIWEADLPRGLLWKSTRSERPTDKDGNPVFRAPSWSWASVQGQVSLVELREQDMYPSAVHSNILVRPLHYHPLPTPESPPLPQWTPLTIPPGRANFLRMPCCELVFLARPKRIDLMKPSEYEHGLSHIKVREFPVQPTTAQNTTLHGPEMPLPQIVALAFLDVAEHWYRIGEEGFESWLLPVLKDTTGSLLLRRDPSDKKFRRLGRVTILKGTSDLEEWLVSGPEEEVHLV